MVDGSFLNQRSDIKNMIEISEAIDSLTNYADSVGTNMYSSMVETTYKKIDISSSDSVKLANKNIDYINTDSAFNSLTSDDKLTTISRTQNRIASLTSDLVMKTYMTQEADRNILRHRSDWHRKITLSLACLMFFFIGAPLGAIIRKGGLGMPVVISVLIFVLYYIIDSGAIRVARSGEMNIILGTWMSTLVLTPLGIFFTYKSNNDSVVFNMDVYTNFFKKILGLRSSRHIFKKEVIIETPDYMSIMERLDIMSNDCKTYQLKHKLIGPPNYYKIFTNNEHDDVIKGIGQRIEQLVEELSNTKDAVILGLLNNYPFLSIKAHKSLFENRWLNMILGLIIPFGILLWLNIWRYRIRLDRDLKTILKNNEDIKERIKNNILKQLLDLWKK